MHTSRLSLATFALALATTSSAYALDEIYSPNVEEGEVSVEYNGSRTFDSHSDKNNVQEHELAFEYGLSDRVELEASGGFAKDPNGSLRMEDAELEGRFQFVEAGEYWLDAGMLTAYDFSTQSHTPDSLETKLLLQKDVGLITNTANIGFVQTMGKNSGGTGGPDYVFLWNTRYRWSQQFQPGIEIQSDLGQGPMLGHFNQQEHYIGPAMYGEIIPHLKYQAAWLFGATPASSQSAARLLLEYEMHF